MKFFKEQTPDYGPDKPPSDKFFLAEKTYYDRIGDPIKQKHNWMRATFLLSFTCVVLAGGLVYQSAKSTVMPYVVHVDGSGAAVAVAPAQQMNYTPQEKDILFHIKYLIENLRKITLDPVDTRNNIYNAYAYLRPEAAQKMNTIFDKESNSRNGQITVQVTVTNVTKLPETKNSYLVRWTEDVFGLDGKLKSSEKMYATLFIELAPPTDVNQLLKNPLGIYVRDFTLSKDFQ